MKGFLFGNAGLQIHKYKEQGEDDTLTLGNINFRTEGGVAVKQDDQELETKAKFVTITFVNQKN